MDFAFCNTTARPSTHHVSHTELKKCHASSSEWSTGSGVADTTAMPDRVLSGSEVPPTVSKALPSSAFSDTSTPMRPILGEGLM